ncbi:MAG: F-type H+-transporting ATPase subunit c [Myxococcota bacterium]|jgi:F-type H+-transporting ATPase subunit c
MFKYRKALSTSVLALMFVCVAAPVALASTTVAHDAAALVSGAAGTQSITVAGDNESTVKAYLALATGLGMALAAFGGAMGQGRAAAAALEGIARNPGASGKLFTPMILGLALIESLVIYSLVISLILSGKI